MLAWLGRDAGPLDQAVEKPQNAAGPPFLVSLGKPASPGTTPAGQGSRGGVLGADTREV